jgi:SAM-dependent methyltransferase
MRDAERWTPSKYVPHRGRWRGSRDTAALGVASRLTADGVVALYEQQLPRHARGALLDLGCGTVPLYGLYAPLVGSVTCVDWAASPHATNHIDIEADLSQPLPLPDAAFDTVILSDVLEHVPEPRHLWREIARVLRPGGHLLLNVPFLYGLHELPHDYGRYTRFGLARMAEDAGFELLLLQATGGSLQVLADLLAKHLARLPLLGAPLAMGLQGAVAMWDRTAPGARLATKTAERFPAGYFLVARRRAG